MEVVWPSPSLDRRGEHEHSKGNSDRVHAGQSVVRFPGSRRTMRLPFMTLTLTPG